MVVEAVEAKAEGIIKTTEVEDVEGNAAAKEQSATNVNEETDGKSNTKYKADQISDKCNADDKIQVSPSNEEKKVNADSKREASPSYTSEKGEFFHDQTEQSGLLFDLKGYEKKALTEFKSRLEEAILMRKLFENKKEKEPDVKEKSNEQESNKTNEENMERQSPEDESSSINKGKAKVEDESNQGRVIEIDENVRLWGVPLLPSRGDVATDAILIKFLRAREFKVNEAFEMLKNTLQWRIENHIDSILEEDLGGEYDGMAYMSGVDREGHPICFNLYGVLANDDFYNRGFGTPESLEKFLRWRVRLMEKEIQNLDFRPGGISSLVQISDLKDTPGPARKDIRLATKQAVALLENNYPEFVARNIFINVPFWYYAFNALLTPFLTQRTKSKFDFARPSRATETLLKYIAGEEIPVKYGGLKREDDPDFSTKDTVSEVPLKAGTTETIEIQAPKAGSNLVWDLIVTGWEVNYREEFVPTDESSYAIIIKRTRWMGWQEESVRNSFKNNEPGKIVITIENGLFKKKRVLYRYKTKDSSSSDV